jgi:hypothetical protein
MYLQTHGVRVGQDSAKKAIGFVEVMLDPFHSFRPNFLNVDWFYDLYFPLF